MKWFEYLFVIDYVLSIIFVLIILFIAIRNRKAIKRYIQLRKREVDDFDENCHPCCDCGDPNCDCNHELHLDANEWEESDCDCDELDCDCDELDCDCDELDCDFGETSPTSYTTLLNVRYHCGTKDSVYALVEQDGMFYVGPEEEISTKGIVPEANLAVFDEFNKAYKFFNGIIYDSLVGYVYEHLINTLILQRNKD